MKKIVLFILTLLLTLPSAAQSVSGNWKSSTGSLVNIQDNGGSITVRITPPNGQTYRWSGQWLRVGSLFSYQTNQGGRTCQLINQNSIQVTLPNGDILKWNRVQTSGGETIGFAHMGLWRSSSGNQIRLSNSNGGLLVTVFYKNGQRVSVPGSIINSNEFKYSTPNTGSSFHCSGLSQGRIKCHNTVRGTATTWSFVGP